MDVDNTKFIKQYEDLIVGLKVEVVSIDTKLDKFKPKPSLTERGVVKLNEAKKGLGSMVEKMLKWYMGKQKI